MKKLSTLLIIAFAMVLGLTQCKKKVDTIATPSDLGEAVHITVNVDDGGKHIVYPGNGAYVFQNGDKLYVGNGSHYIGTLTYSDGVFQGYITAPEVGEDLYFYFVGGLTPSTAPVANSTENFTVNIADQSSKLPVLSFGRSTSTYTTSTTTYRCTLLNKCGLVKFVPATATPNLVKVGGMKTTATIDFANPGITPAAATGTITLKSEGDDAKWAILLPQEKVSNPTVSIEGYECTLSEVPEVDANDYITSGIDIAMTRVYPYIDAEFTVGSTTPGSGTSVKFSKGNLQYLGTGISGTETPKWRFADNQWDYMGDGPTSGTNQQGNVAIEGYSAYNTGSESAVGSETTADKQAARDLFGWGTSGGGTPTTYPYSTMTDGGSSWYSYYGGTSHNIAGTDFDWGVYNKAVIENNDGKNWRTLTKNEWSNLFNRTKTIGGSSKKLYGLATVMGVNGVVILPDNWDGSVDGGFTYAVTDFIQNMYTDNSTVTWATMESAGAVFLPTAGNRQGSSVSGEANPHGYYWSTTRNQDDSDCAYYVLFSSGYVNPTRGFGLRYYGYSVRLVFDN